MQIEHQCPQCGGPVILEETDRLLTCGFCRTRLFIQPRDYFRYCLSPSDPFLEDIIYVPYWRFRGMHFLCKTSGIKDGIIDKTFLAVRKRGLSATLGIRPQALKTKFLRPAEKMVFLKPGIVFDRSSAETKKAITYELVRIPETRFVRGGRNGEYIEVSDTRLEVKEERVHAEAFVADTVSIVYAPFYARNGKLFDAITNETIDSDPLDDPSDTETFSGDWQVNFLPTICPNCGWDTIAERDSCIMFCSQCSSAWEAEGKGFKRIAYRTATSDKVADKPKTYLPFWRIRADIEGVKLASYADLIKFGNLPKAPRPEWETKPFYLWVPAFKTTPSAFLRVAKQFTIADPDTTSDPLPREPIFPVNLPLQDALDTILMIIADIALRKKDVLPRLPDIKTRVQETLLVLVPFAETNHEYVQPDINCGFMKNALEWGRRI